MKFSQLPAFLQKKITKLDEAGEVQWVSAIGLFNSVFYFYPSEQLYLDGYELPIPKSNQINTNKAAANLNDAEAQKYSKWQWAPPGYGGFTPDRYRGYY